MGDFLFPLTARLGQAQAQDRDLAEAVIDRLRRDGRPGHPAFTHLERVLAEPESPDDQVHLAAVAFEAAARLRLGAVAGGLAAEGARHDAVAAFLVDRPPTAWEGRSALPYTEVDWRRVVAAAAGDMRQDRFDMPMTIPGAHLFATLRVHTRDDDAFLAMILGPAMRDDTLDPVATSGNFLAQAMPGYVDLDLLFRQHRERLVAQAGREG
ncbi:MAG: hypothetical protein ACOCY0_02155 [Roseicyclus sp.]